MINNKPPSIINNSILSFFYDYAKDDKLKKGYKNILTERFYFAGSATEFKTYVENLRNNDIALLLLGVRYNGENASTIVLDFKYLNSKGESKGDYISMSGTESNLSRISLPSLINVVGGSSSSVNISVFGYLLKPV